MSLTSYPRDYKMPFSRENSDKKITFYSSIQHRILCGVLDTLDEHYLHAYKLAEVKYLWKMLRYDWGNQWISNCEYPEWITHWLDKLKVKEEWMTNMKEISKQVRTKVSNKSWIKFKVKPIEVKPIVVKTIVVKPIEKKPIEFPQDVFNVIKDYMDIVDVPTPVWNEMMSKSIKEISTHRKYKGTGPDYYKPFPEGTNLRKVKVAEKRQRYFVGVIKEAKKSVVKYYDHMEYMGEYNEEGLYWRGRHWIGAVECNGPKYSRCHGPVRAYVGFEATNYTMMVNQRISDLVSKNGSYECGITSMENEKTNMCVCV